MIATWLLYCTGVAALLAVAAVVGEAALRAVGRPVRWVWAGAMVGSVALPLGAWLGWPRWGGEVAAAAEPVFLPEVMVAASLPSVPAAGLLDRPLLYGWLFGSGVLLLVVLGSLIRLGRARARWRQAEVSGTRVLVSGDTGPAALGFLRGAIVIPEWALALDERLRELMLLHESEHLRAGDPRLVLAALAVLVMMPWNPALWWQFWRLRQALELDCDARVLRGRPDARSYGALLLEVGRHRSVAGLVMAGLSEPRTFLERRIRLMRRLGAGRQRGRSLAGTGVAVLLVIGACEAPEPTAVPVASPDPEGVAGHDVVPGTLADGADPATCQPLFVLDGVPVSRDPADGPDPLASLDPDEIAFIEVAKGKIGSDIPREMIQRARCGVVNITTKAAQARAAADPAPTRVGDAAARARRDRVETLARLALRDAAVRSEQTTAAADRSVLVFEFDGDSADGGAHSRWAAAERAFTRAAARASAREFRPFTPDMVQPELRNTAEVQKALERYYPALLRDAGIGGTVNVLFWIDEAGRVTRYEIDGSSGYPALDEAAQKVAGLMEFGPAQRNGRPVRVEVAIPVKFRAPQR